MSRASVLARGRAAAEAGMVDACTIVRVAGTTTDRDTGVVTETTTSVYSGACRLQEQMAFARETQPTPDNPTLMRYRVLQLPVATSTGVRKNDQVTITACPNDPDMVGKVLVVRDLSGKTEATSRRLGVEEAT